MKKKDIISAEDFDKKFDEGEDSSRYLDWSKARRPLLDQKRINVDLPDQVGVDITEFFDSNHLATLK